MKRKAENAVTVDSERYVKTVHDCIAPQHPSKREHTHFQADGATSDSARISMNTVNALFSGCVMLRNEDIPRSPGLSKLTACDFFFLMGRGGVGVA